MRRFFIALSAVLLVGGTAGARGREDAGFYRRGLYLGVDVSAGSPVREGEALRPDYGVKVAAGMRFCPQLVVAVAAQGGCNVGDGTNFLPVSLHLRSDLLDRRVSPFVSLDLGYAFQFSHTRCSEENILVNGELFKDRLGGKTLEEYLSQFTGSERDRAARDLYVFRNGDNRYVSGMHEGALQFSKEGFFSELTLGAAFNLPGLDRGNVFVGLSCGLAEYAGNLWLRTRTNDFVRWSGHDRLPSGERAFTEGRDGTFRERLRAGVGLKVGFSF